MVGTGRWGIKERSFIYLSQKQSTRRWSDADNEIMDATFIGTRLTAGSQKILMVPGSIDQDTSLYMTPDPLARIPGG